MGPPLNFTQDYQIKVGSLDVTACVAELPLNRPLPEIGTPYSWTGSMTLRQPLDPSLLAESLDDLANPSRWGRGNHPVQIWVEGTLVATVRILEYFFDDSPDALIGEAQLGDVLTLYDEDGPPQAWQDLIVGTPFLFFNMTLGGLINKVLTDFGLTCSISLDLPLPTIPDKPQGSPIQWAQQLLGERGYWLYVDSSETVRIQRYPTSPSSVLFSRALSQVTGFKRRRGVERPVTQVVVAGAFEAIGQPAALLPETSNRLDQGILVEVREVIRTDEKQRYEVRTEVKETLANLNEEVYNNQYVENNALIVSRINTHTKISDYEGKVLREIKRQEAPLGVALPDLAKDLAEKNLPPISGSTKAEKAQNKAIAMAEVSRAYYQRPILAFEEETIWEYDKSVVTAKRRVQRKLFRVGQYGYEFRVSEQEIDTYTPNARTSAGDPPTPSYYRHFEFWQRASSKSGKQLSTEYSPPKEVTWFFPRQLALVDIQDDRDAQPPKPDYTKPEHNVGAQPVSNNTRFSGAGNSPSPGRHEEPASSLSSPEDCLYLASLVGSLKWQAYYGREYGVPVLAEWLADPSPFGVHAVHNGIFVGCAEVLSLAEGRLELSFDGYYLGAISPVPEPGAGTYTFVPPVPPFAVANPGAYSVTVAYQASGVNSPVAPALSGSASYSVTVTYTGAGTIAAPTVYFEELVIAEQYPSGKSYAWAAQTITYRITPAVSGWGTSTLSYTAPDGTPVTLNASLGGVWVQKNGSGIATTPTPVDINQWVIAEQYSSGKSYAWAESTILYRAASTPTGWNSATLDYTAADGSAASLNASLGGVWVQKNGSGIATTPTPYTY